ncbi:MAG: hypothetical protein PVF58_14000 [Candidatus Methanofastidiosia archaeon]|jgi:hypothetical protein
MDQEIYLIETGKRKIKDFINTSHQTLDDIEESLSIKKSSHPAYLQELSSKYRVTNVYYSGNKPTEARLSPIDYKVKDIKKAHDTINRELDYLDIYATTSISDIRGILGKLLPFEENKRQSFNRKFSRDKRNISEIIQETVEDFLPRFKKRFGTLSLDGNPLGHVINDKITGEIIERRDILKSSFQKEISKDIVKDLFKYVMIYAKTIRRILEVIEEVISQPGSKIKGTPWNPNKAAVKEVLQEEIETLKKDPLSFYEGRLETETRKKVENSTNRAVNTIDTQRDMAITRIGEQQSTLETQLTQHQRALIRAMEEENLKLKDVINQQKNEIINAMQLYQQRANDSIEEHRQQSIRELQNTAEVSQQKLEQVGNSLVNQFETELKKRLVEVSHKLEHLERREYEITEKLRELSKYIQDHPSLNTSVLTYWKKLLNYVFMLHTNARDAAIPEEAKTIWLNGINQALEAVLTVKNDRLAERAMREGRNYETIPTTDTDCQKIWDRFTTYINNPESADIDYLERKMKAHAEEPSIKNVAIPSILYRDGFMEFDKNYRSIDIGKDRTYQQKKQYFKTFFVIAYDGMVEKFRDLIKNMVV